MLLFGLMQRRWRASLIVLLSYCLFAAVLLGDDVQLFQSEKCCVRVEVMGLFRFTLLYLPRFVIRFMVMVNPTLPFVFWKMWALGSLFLYFCTFS